MILSLISELIKPCNARLFESDGTDEGLTFRLHHAEQVNENGDIIVSNDLGGVEDATTFTLSNKTGLQVLRQSLRTSAPDMLNFQDGQRTGRTNAKS